MNHPEFLHLSISGKAACDQRPLDPDLDSDSPECDGMVLCPSCWRLLEQFRRESVANRMAPC